MGTRKRTPTGGAEAGAASDRRPFVRCQELLAKLHSLTNLRAVRDPASDTGWTIELGPFPGWRDVPTW